MTLKLGLAGALPPAPTGPADYLAGLLPELARHATISCFVDDVDEIDAALRAQFNVRPLHQRFDPSVDIVCYHLANNVWQLPYVRAALQGPPGVATIHDASIHHLIAGEIFARDGSDEYASFLESAYGDEGRILFERRRDGYGGDAELFMFDVLASVLKNQLGAVVHSEYARRLVARAVPGLPTKVVPHYSIGAVRPASEIDFEAPAGRFVIGHLGYITPPKRPELVLAALAELRAMGVDALLVFAGHLDPTVPLDTDIERLGLSGAVRVTGYLTEDELDAWASAVDVVVSLRWPHVGETSGTLMRAVHAGRPVVVQGTGAWAEIPTDAVRHVPAGDDEVGALARVLYELSRDPDMRAHIGARAAEYANTIGTAAGAAREYVEFASECATKQRTTPASVAETRSRTVAEFLARGPDAVLESFAATGSVQAYSQVSLDDHRKRYHMTLSKLPPAHLGARLLDIGAIPAMLRLLAGIWGYDVRACGHGVGAPRELWIAASAGLPEFRAVYDSVDVEIDPFPYDVGEFDVVTCWEVIEHLGRDPMHMLCEANRVLRPGGVLMLTTPNVVRYHALRAALTGEHPYFWSQFLHTATPDRHNREYTPNEIRLMLRSAGFSQDTVSTENVWDQPDDGVAQMIEAMGGTTQDRGDIIVAVVRKVSHPVDRYPTALYR